MVKEGLCASGCITPAQKTGLKAGTGFESPLPEYQENCVMYVEDRRKLWLSGLLLVALLALAGSWWMMKKPAHGAYGAISLSSSSLGYGAAWGYADADAARARAQAECAKAGATDCAVRVSVAGSCAALAMTGQANHVFAVTDPDRTSASALALAQCQATGAADCVVQTNFCGSGS
jgi:hypothetical protein